jgi:DNA-binding MarR family transcriptional regulator
VATSEPVSARTPPRRAIGAPHRPSGERGPAGAGPADDDDADVPAVSELADQVSAVEGAITDVFRLAASRRLHRARQQRSGVTLSRTGWEFLRRVDDLGPIRVSQLAELLDLSLPVTSRALQRLEEDGFVVRQPDPSDGRAARFVASPQGSDARARIQATMHDELDAVLSGWPPADRRVLADLLPRLVADMRAGST